MNTVNHIASPLRRFTLAALLTLVLVWASACQKRCGANQADAAGAEPFRSITQAEWRLVETSRRDNVFENLDKFNFLIFTFDQSFSGQLRLVKDNLEFETPVCTLRYNVDPSSKFLRVRFEDPFGGGGGDFLGGGETTTSSGSCELSQRDFTYRLTRQLELQDDKGAYYRFVPYEGMVLPDDNCEF